MSRRSPLLSWMMMTSPYWNRGSTWGNTLDGSCGSVASPVAAVGVVAVVRVLAVNRVARVGETLLRVNGMCNVRPVNENGRHRPGIPVVILFLVLFLVNKTLVCE